MGKGEGSGEGWGEGEGKGQGNGGTWKGDLCGSCDCGLKCKNEIHFCTYLNENTLRIIHMICPNMINVIIQIYDKLFNRLPWVLSSSTRKFLHRRKNWQRRIRKIHWIP